MIQPIIRTDSLVIYQGEAIDWPGEEHIDLVFTNPYGPLPTSLHGHPMVIHQWVHNHRQAELWCGNRLKHCVGLWNRNREAFWSTITQHLSVDIAAFVPEEAGWYPEEMVRRLLTVFGRPGFTVWDGFMGRGTIGKITLEYGMSYVGIERLSAHVALALDYLEIPKP
jgi:hypothetical protein